jgi:hypothetical protein
MTTQNANQLITTLKNQSQTGYEENQKKDSERFKTNSLLTMLWPRMADMYGHKFTSQFGDEPSNTWIRCFEGVTPEQIANGLTKCLTKCKEWPPGAVEFRAMCLNEDEEKSWEHSSAAYKPFDKSRALEQLAASEEEQRAALDKLKSIFKH